MKKYVKIIIGSFMLLTFSCNRDIKQNNDFNANKASVCITVSSNERTVLPEIINLENDFNLSFELIGTKEDQSQQIKKTWISTDIKPAYLVMLNDKNIILDLGNWDFTLLVKKENQTLFISTLTNIYIKTGNNSLNFGTLDKVFDGTGFIGIKLNFTSKGRVQKVIAGLYNLDGTEVEGFEKEEIPIETTNSISTVFYEKKSVPSGTYLIKFELYSDKAATNLMNIYTEIIKISNGLSSNAERSIEYLNTLYTITYELNGGEFEDGFSAKMSFTQYESFKLPTQENLRKEGYIFSGWINESNEKIHEIPNGTTEDIKLVAMWNPSYKVEHYKQNIYDDNYSLYETEIKFGLTNSLTEATSNSYDGFSTKEIKQDIILDDCSTVIKIFYDRNFYTVTFHGIEESLTKTTSITLKYEDFISVQPTPLQRSGYTFLGWFLSTDMGKTFYDNCFNFNNVITSNLDLYSVYKCSAMDSGLIEDLLITELKTTYGMYSSINNIGFNLNQVQKCIAKISFYDGNIILSDIKEILTATETPYSLFYEKELSDENRSFFYELPIYANQFYVGTIPTFIGMKGDANLDNKTDAKDASCILSFYADKMSGKADSLLYMVDYPLRTDGTADLYKNQLENYGIYETDILEEFSNFLGDVVHKNISSENNWKVKKENRTVDASDASCILNFYAKKITSNTDVSDIELWNETLQYYSNK